MTRQIGRREFVKTGARLGVSAVLGGGILAARPRPKSPPPADVPDLAVVTGSDIFQNAVQAVELLGGMSRFVPQGGRVALLPNVQSRHPGTFTKPEILRAVIRMCRQAGAAKVDCLSWLTQKHWDDTGLASAAAEEGADVLLVTADEEEYRTVPIPRGRKLTEGRVVKALYAHDVFINLPITKDHAGNRFTGTLKNMMGLNHRASNRTFHRENWKTDPEDIAHLDQCIADLNTVLEPTLNLVDAVEFIISNGPMGPGELHKPRKVVAGKDRVAVDAYCASLWGLSARDILTIRFAEEHGLGTMDLSSLKIKESVLAA
ncbi:MAG: hypothetical protein A2Y56_15935 [Candidatus Aminicenantes bacterium RBG_13_63_10]|nr:MAG: hypothetical protein A2Y56_15935 [Candidatus Aminicenantes bacterium RBG_13_63_10]